MKLLRRTALTFLASIAMLAFTQPAMAQEGGIETFAAETLFDGGWRVSETHIYRFKDHQYSGSSKDSDPLDRTFIEHRYVTSIDYGLRPDLMVTALIPYVDKQLETRSPGPGKSRLDASGLGDIALLTKYRVHKKDWKQSAAHFAVMAGVKLPTGKTTATENGLRLSPSLQPGSGSIDPFVALLGQLSIDRWRWDASIFYKHNTEGTQDYKSGDAFSIHVDMGYRYWHETYPGPTASAKIGLLYKHQDRAKSDGHTVRNSGGDELFAQFGLGFHPIPRMDISLKIEAPLYQDYGGTQLGTDLRTVFAFGIRF